MTKNTDPDIKYSWIIFTHNPQCIKIDSCRLVNENFKMFTPLPIDEMFFASQFNEPNLIAFCVFKDIKIYL